MCNNDIHQHNTRSKLNYYTPPHSLTITEKSPRILGLFNALPRDLKSASSLACFKRSIKAFLMHHCMYTLNEFFEFLRSSRNAWNFNFRLKCIHCFLIISSIDNCPYSLQIYDKYKIIIINNKREPHSEDWKRINLHGWHANVKIFKIQSMISEVMDPKK